MYYYHIIKNAAIIIFPTRVGPSLEGFHPPGKQTGNTEVVSFCKTAGFQIRGGIDDNSKIIFLISQ